MFIITNREVDESRNDFEAFKSGPNEKGPNELRLADATLVNGKWHIRVLPDHISDEMADEVGLARVIDSETNTAKPIFASRYVARKILQRVNPKMLGKPGPGKNLLFFIHGYNNDVKAVLDRAEKLEKQFGVEVVAFSWPANGGGVHGVVSYMSDKRDALASTGALDRCFGKLNECIAEIHNEHVKHIEQEANRRFPDNAEKWDRFFSSQAEKWCPFSINMLLHSMGNYLYKHMLQSSVYRGNLLIFDNVLLVAADTNNEQHAEWVDKIQCRNRVFITLNENDVALRASRMKMGEQQKARLGHYPYELNSKRALYVSFTNSPKVGDSHAYFEAKALTNAKIRTFFTRAINGEAAETGVEYDVACNLYSIR